MKDRILWFQDGVKMRTPSKNWSRLDQLHKQLVSIAGNPLYDHEIIDPLVCAEELFRQIDFDKHSVIVDLSGLFNTALHEITLTPVVDTFRLSRIRDVLSPRLDGVGHIVSLSHFERLQLQQSIDLSRPLFIDDVCWSGRTVIDSARILGVPLDHASFGFLVLNQGIFGEGKPGPADIIKQQGGEILQGRTVWTPNDDGFHLADFFDNPFLSSPDIFDLVIKIQEFREMLSVQDCSNRKELEQEIKHILGENREVLFPSSISGEQMSMLREEGKLLAGGGFNKKSFFDINPPNWLMPSFSRRVNSNMLYGNRLMITDTLREMHNLIHDKEVHYEMEVVNETHISRA